MQISRSMFIRLVIILFFLSLSSIAVALEKVAVPEPLKQWVPWAMYGHEKLHCPFPYNQFDLHYCSWPKQLTLDVNKTGGRFTQHWSVYSKTWIGLPGNDQFWPQEVTVNKKPVSVGQQSAIPSILLTPGEYQVSGRFTWRTMPESIPIPRNTGLLAFTLEGKPIAFPRVESDGRLWLNPQQDTSKVSEDKLSVDVFRRLVDDMPMQLETRIDLNVVGKSREITLGPLFGPAVIPLAITGPLPMRLEANQVLRIQVRPGHWSLTVTGRYAGEVSELQLPASNLPDTEYWAIQQHPELRVIEIKGVDAVDPRQTRIPVEWQRLPVYRVSKSDKVTLVTKRRGQAELPPNELTLLRDLWLDFDGNGYTFKDAIAGNMNQHWRLSLTPAMTLGSAKVNGIDQLVTSYGGKGEQGIEIRHGAINVEAAGRINSSTRTIPAAGWQDNFKQVNTRLHLPPGWRLFAASGADSVGGAAWIEQWSLLDIFLVLIAAIATHLLLGWKWGLVTLGCLVLTWHERGAPQYVWLFMIASIALLRVAPPGMLQRVVRSIRYASILLLLIIALPYIVTTVRTTLYPQLEQPRYAAANYAQSSFPESRRQAAPAKKAESTAGMLSSIPREYALQESDMADKRDSLSKVSRANYADAFDPKAKVQTGPGLPDWRWSTIAINYNGPVQSTQTLSMTLLSPRMTGVVNIACIVLVIVLGLRLAGVTFRQHKLSVDVLKSMLLAGCLVGLFSHAQPVYAEYPPQKLLDQLQKRLIKAPDCLPACAQIPRMAITADKVHLQIRLEIHAQQTVAIPLPGLREAWHANTLVIDNQPAAVRLGQDQGYWVAVPKGIHNVLMSGELPNADVLQLPLPLLPHQVTFASKQWTINGIHDDGKIDSALQLERIDKASKATETLEPSSLPPFVTIERTLRLGLEWHVDTVVSRISPTTGSFSIAVPLLDNESVTSAGIDVQQHAVQLHFAPGTRRIHWTSLLSQTQRIKLTASNNVAWLEQWSLDVSPVWHVDIHGINQISHQTQSGERFPKWRPWPNESITIDVARPAGITGKTQTIEHSALLLKPGKRITDANLTFDIRSSQAVQHIITLPPDIVLKNVAINGQTYPLRLENARQLRLPLSPGLQKISINWQAKSGMGNHYVTPSVDLGLDSVNSSIRINVPTSRWVLFLKGPVLGPAVLFWGVLLVVILVGYGLSRVKSVPLRHYQWMLLGIGFTQLYLPAAILFVGWFFALAWREQSSAIENPKTFNIVQVVLGVYTVLAMVVLIEAVGTGLLGYPQMQIAGNNSYSSVLNWYTDRASSLLPTASVVSVPLWVYRTLMLLWSLWLAFSVLQWLKWAWQCYSKGGLWHRVKLVKPDGSPSKQELLTSAKGEQDT